MTGRHRHDDGVATVAGIALIAVLILVGVATAVVGGAVLAHRRAQAAADLAALAAAQALQGQGGPCRQAARIAHANGAELRACGVPDYVTRDRMRFLVFLDHGYDEQGWGERQLVDVWSVEFLNLEQATRLADFIARHFGEEQYRDLLRELRRAAG